MNLKKDGSGGGGAGSLASNGGGGDSSSSASSSSLSTTPLTNFIPGERFKALLGGGSSSGSGGSAGLKRPLDGAGDTASSKKAKGFNSFA